MVCLRRILALAVASRLAIPFAACGQDDARGRIRARVELVLVPVTVKDASGRLVPDIRPEEFRVLEDGVEQQISVFSLEPFPLSVVVLLDNGLKQKAAEQVQSSLLAIAGGFGDRDEVALCRFDTRFEHLSEFSTDTDQVFARLRRAELERRFPGQGSGPMTAGPRINGGASSPGTPGRAVLTLSGRETKNIDDAVYAAGELLRGRDRERRKIIFLISDGLNSRNNTVSYNDTVRLLLSADISVYAIGVGEAVLNGNVGVLSK